VRVVYSDESGVGSIKDEPFSLVTAIMVNMDSQWHPINDAIDGILRGVMSPERAARYEIKGKRLFSEVQRNNADSRKILAQILNVTAQHQVQIFYGAVDRRGYESVIKQMRLASKNTNIAVDLLAGPKSSAFVSCASFVERWVHMGIPKEQVLWIADEGKAQTELKEGLETLKVFQRLGTEKLFGPQAKDILASEPHLCHIVDTVYFGKSNESRALQLADVCCSTVLRWLRRDPLGTEFYRLIQFRTIGTDPPLFTKRAAV
jgi:hypothetical protein